MVSSLVARHARSRLVAVGCALVLALVAPAIYAQMRIAVVDIQRALLDTNQGQHSRNTLKGLFEKRQVELNGRRETLAHQRSELTKQRASLDEATMRQRMQDYEQQYEQLQEDFQRYQQEIAQRESEMTKQIYLNLKTVIHQIGDQDRFTAIFERAGIVWSPQDMDLTDRVVAQFNQQFPVHDEPASGAPAGGSPHASGAPGSSSRPLPTPHPRGEQDPNGPPPARH